MILTKNLLVRLLFFGNHNFLINRIFCFVLLDLLKIAYKNKYW